MKEEEKELLLKDLCARLHYGVKATLSEYHIDEVPYNGTYCNKIVNLGIYEDTINLLNHIEKYGVKPYLRPMSSMTEKERKECNKLRLAGGMAINVADYSDWLNSHHFDYRGLIEKGLALEATNDIYKD